MTMWRAWQAALLIFVVSVLVPIVGCGGNDSSGRRMISGTVTLDGERLRTGSISFEPIGDTRVGGGAVITNGKYEIDAAHGLTEGEYCVVISAAERSADGQLAPSLPGAGGRTVSRELIPPEYNVQRAKKIVVGPTGPYVYNFDIVTRKK